MIGILDSGQKIVTSQLIFNLDAAQLRSYPGSGTTWSDLSPTAKSASLILSPTFQTSNGGAINFKDTSYQYADTNYNFGSLSNWTVEAWTKVGASLTNKVTTIVTNQFNLVNNLNFSIGTNNAGVVGGDAQWNLVAGFYNGSWRNTVGHPISLNTWFQVVGSYDGSTINQYYNGAVTSSLSYSGTSATGGTVRIAARWDDLTQVSTNYYSGSIAIVRIYNRALASTEVLQNYNAVKSRFGLS